MVPPRQSPLGLGEAPRFRWVDLALPGAAAAQQAVAGGQSSVV